MSNCAFTICAANYIGLAEVLEKSIRLYNTDVDFYIVVADEPELLESQKRENILIAKTVLSSFYSEEKWTEMAFKYDLTEFCTAIKPSSVKYFFERGYDKCIYFDPDIFTFSGIEVIYNLLDSYSAVVTPHITQIELAPYGNIAEHQLLCSGTFNLGFLGVKKTDAILSFMDWWQAKLENKCFASIPEDLFTDQKWMDLMPSFLGSELCISRNKGLNMAPWNFHERKIIQKDGEFYVENRCESKVDSIDRLVFVHFSGYKYKTLMEKGTLIQKNIEHMGDYSDLNVLFDLYRINLKACNFHSFIDYQYTYNTFSDGRTIPSELRRLYRALVEAENYKENPFLNDSYFYRTAVSLKWLSSSDNKSTVSSNYQQQVESQRKQKVVNFVNKILSLYFKIFGLKRYIFLYKLFRFYGIWENNYFLIKPKNSSFKFRKLY